MSSLAGARRRGCWCRLQSPAVSLVGHLPNPVPVGRFDTRLQALSPDAGVPKLERGRAAALGDAVAQPLDDQHPQRRAVPCGELAGLVEQRIGNLYGCLHVAICIMIAISMSNERSIAMQRDHRTLG